MKMPVEYEWTEASLIPAVIWQGEGSTLVLFLKSLAHSLPTTPYKEKWSGLIGHYLGEQLIPLFLLHN